MLFSQVRRNTTIDNIMALARQEHTKPGTNFFAIPNDAFMAVRTDGNAWGNCLDPTQKIWPMFSDGNLALHFIVVLKPEQSPKQNPGRR